MLTQRTTRAIPVFIGVDDEADEDQQQERDEEDALAGGEHAVGAVLREAGQELGAGGADVLLEVDPPQQAVEVGAGDHVGADPQVGELADRLVGLVVERVGDRDVERLVVDLERDAATLALERLGDHRHRLGRGLDPVEVDERDAQLVGERRGEVALADLALVVEDLADPAAGLLLDLERLREVVLGDQPAADEDLADPARGDDRAAGEVTLAGDAGVLRIDDPAAGTEAGGVAEPAVDAVDRGVDLVGRREHDLERVGGEREGDVLRHRVGGVGHRQDQRLPVVGDRASSGSGGRRSRAASAPRAG